MSLVSTKFFWTSFFWKKQDSLLLFSSLVICLFSASASKCISRSWPARAVKSQSQRSLRTNPYSIVLAHATAHKHQVPEIEREPLQVQNPEIRDLAEETGLEVSAILEYFVKKNDTAGSNKLEIFLGAKEEMRYRCLTHNQLGRRTLRIFGVPSILSYIFFTSFFATQVDPGPSVSHLPWKGASGPKWRCGGRRRETRGKRVPGLVQLCFSISRH